jgi:hypothetical protein
MRCRELFEAWQQSVQRAAYVSPATAQASSPRSLRSGGGTPPQQPAGAPAIHKPLSRGSVAARLEKHQAELQGEATVAQGGKATVGMLLACQNNKQ